MFRGFGGDDVVVTRIEDREGPRLSWAGNTFAPCVATMKARGYEIEVSYWREGQDYQQRWSAAKDGHLFFVDTPVDVLGLIGLWETRGDDWQASDEEFDSYIRMCDEAPVYAETDEGNRVREE